MGNQLCTSWQITWKQAGNTAFKTALPPSSEWDYPERAPNGIRIPLLPHLLQHHQAEVTPSSREAVQRASLTANHQSSRIAVWLCFLGVIWNRSHSVKTGKITDDATLLLLMSCTRKWWVFFLKVLWCNQWNFTWIWVDRGTWPTSGRRSLKELTKAKNACEVDLQQPLSAVFSWHSVLAI